MDDSLYRVFIKFFSSLSSRKKTIKGKYKEKCSLAIRRVEELAGNLISLFAIVLSSKLSFILFAKHKLPPLQIEIVEIVL